jgi:peptidyl-prolyl cis-trans isomerase B (cyclophilin B)
MKFLRVTFDEVCEKIFVMKIFNSLCALSFALFFTAGCSNEKNSASDTPNNLVVSTSQPSVPADTNDVAVLKTSDGEMVIQFWPDVAPNTVSNFVKLAQSGFYDGTTFHRIIDGFMIQGGDPNTKDLSKENEYGQGGPGYTIQGEVSNRSDRHHTRGVISMANSGSPDTAGSQFFICLADLPQLDGGYTTFGKLIKGDDVLTQLGKTPVGPNSQGESSKPQQRVELISVKIVPADSVK